MDRAARMDAKADVAAAPEAETETEPEAEAGGSSGWSVEWPGAGPAVSTAGESDGESVATAASGQMPREKRIRVCVRVRPFTKSESARVGNKAAWTWHENTIYQQIFPAHRRSGSTTPPPSSSSSSSLPSSYAFDHLYGPTARTHELYEDAVREAIVTAVDGCHSSVFVYGQTGTGKTHTMQGAGREPGLIRMAVDDVFAHIARRADDHTEFLLRFSYLEIYNEKVYDLLAAGARSDIKILELARTPTNATNANSTTNTMDAYVCNDVVVKGLTEEIVVSADHVLALVEAGNFHRHMGATNANASSSRAHTIFRLVIESQTTIDPTNDTDINDLTTQMTSTTNTNATNNHTSKVRSATLNLVDLAGSESVRLAHTSGQHLEEGRYINRSLLTLGHIIWKLSRGRRSTARSASSKDTTNSQGDDHLALSQVGSLPNRRHSGFGTNAGPGSVSGGSTYSMYSTTSSTMGRDTVHQQQQQPSSASSTQQPPKPTQQHLPYRNSKLTRILQPALGGQAQITIICTIAPSVECLAETHNTLKFASRARRVKSRAAINESAGESALLRKYRARIKELEDQWHELEFRKKALVTKAAAAAKHSRQRNTPSRRSVAATLASIEDRQVELKFAIENINRVILNSAHRQQPLTAEQAAAEEAEVDAQADVAAEMDEVEAAVAAELDLDGDQPVQSEPAADADAVVKHRDEPQAIDTTDSEHDGDSDGDGYTGERHAAIEPVVEPTRPAPVAPRPPLPPTGTSNRATAAVDAPEPEPEHAVVDAQRQLSILASDGSPPTLVRRSSLTTVLKAKYINELARLDQDQDQDRGKDGAESPTAKDPSTPTATATAMPTASATKELEPVPSVQPVEPYEPLGAQDPYEPHKPHELVLVTSLPASSSPTASSSAPSPSASSLSSPTPTTTAVPLLTTSQSHRELLREFVRGLEIAEAENETRLSQIRELELENRHLRELLLDKDSELTALRATATSAGAPSQLQS